MTAATPPAREREQRELPCFGCCSTTAERSPCPDCDTVLCQQCAEAPDLFGYACCCDIDEEVRMAIGRARESARAEFAKRVREAVAKHLSADEIASLISDDNAGDASRVDMALVRVLELCEQESTNAK